MSISNLNLDTGSIDSEDDSVLLLSIQNRQEREHIQHYLPDSLNFEIDAGNLANGNFDLCILDEHTFDLNKQVLMEMKEEVAPIFLPVLLLSASQDSVRNSSSVLQFADDVVYIPASSDLLESRIKMLLKQREYSLKLEQKNRELARKNKQLAEEKQKYQLLTENSTDMISRHDPDGNYLYASPAAEELTGYTPEELMGQNAFDNMHPEDWQQLMSESKARFREQSVVRYTFRKKTKSGAYKWVETTMRPINDEDTGVITEIQASTRDISARKEYERKLKEEKEFIDKSIESLPELFFLIDEDQNFVRWNNIESQLGYSDEEIENMHPLDFYCKKDHEFITSKINEAFTEGAAEAEVQMRAKNGDLVPFFVTAKSFNRGDHTFLVGSCINLKEMKEAEFELKQQRKLMHAIINQTQAIIYVKDSDGKLRLVNDSYLELFDLDRDDVIGKTDRELFGNEFADNVEGNDRKVLETGETLEIEEKIPLEGETRYYNTIKYPLVGVPGFENSMCGISTDITDQKNIMESLQERIKEQRCLYDISRLSKKDYDVEQLLSKAVTLLPDGWQYPEIAEAAIHFDGETYETDNYRENDWMLSTTSSRIEDNPLTVSVVYTQEKPPEDEGPFIEEERKLIDSITDTLSSQIDRIITHRKLKESKERWKRLVNNDPDLIQITDPDGIVEFINPAGAQMFGKDSPEEIIGNNYLDIIEIENLELAKNRNQKLLNGEQIPPERFKITASDGEVRYLRVQSVLATLDSGEKGIQNVAEDITERIKYERELKDSLREKEVLLQEVHHRVKNNLAVVSGMLQLQGFKTDNSKIQQVLEVSEKRIKTMALIHEKLYQSESLSDISFGDYVSDLVERIGEVAGDAGNIELDLTYDSFNLNVNQAVPCALIINEIVSNAFEHAFTDDKGGTIRIVIRDNDGNIFVKIEDDGRGMPQDLEAEDTESIGFTIVNTLITQLEADKEVSGDDGFSFAFSFKKQELRGSSSTLI
jgi:PAS domain S-box-containing protein